MNFYQDRSFGMKFAPVIRNYILITKITKLISTSSIINKVTLNYLACLKSWHIDRKLRYDYKND